MAPQYCAILGFSLSTDGCLSLTKSSLWESPQIIHCQKSRFLGYICVRRRFAFNFNFNRGDVVDLQSYGIWWNEAKWPSSRRSRSFKVTNFRINFYSLYATSYATILVTFFLCRTVTEIWRIIAPIFAVDMGVPLFNALVWGEPLNSGIRHLAPRN